MRCKGFFFERAVNERSGSLHRLGGVKWDPLLPYHRSFSKDSEVCNLIDFTLSPDSLLLLVNHCQLQRIQGMESTQALLANKGRLKQWSLQLVYTPSLAKLLTLLTPPIKLAISRKYVNLQV
jgi:hypothetical protein